MMDKKVKSFVTQALRRSSYRWPGRYIAMKKAHVGRNQYKCASCPEGIVHPRKGVQLDHIIPVVDPITGFTTWDDFINRMFVDETKFQVLCRECHSIKTGKENSGRKRKKKK